MMKRTMKAGWLVVAAALMIGMTACSTDDNLTEEPTATHGVQVTVSAGLDNGDGNTTRADVDYDATAKTRTLKFTTGDRLYVYRRIEGESVVYLKGILTMDGEPTNDGLSATFSGTIKAYDTSWTEIANYDYAALGDVLTGTEATLLPSGAATGCFDETKYGNNAIYEPAYCIAPDVNTLMKTALWLTNSYNGTGYTLTKQYPILNCAVGTLSPNIEYAVKLRFAPSQSNYEANSGIDEYIYTPMVRTDGMGNVRFAISAKNNNLIANKYWVLQLIGGGQTKDYVIGQKQFAAKVYNLTREIYFPYQQAGSEDYITTTFGYNESTWSQQTEFGLLKFKYMLCTSPGVGISQAPISTVTINDGNGHTYTVTDTRDNGYGGTPGFDTSFQFYVGIWPVSGKTLTITYDPHNSQYTYVGTVANVTLAGGNVLNLGTVELVKTTN